MVDHFLPPSVSRRCIIWGLILLPALKAAGYHEPNEDNVNSALSDMFKSTMNLQAPVSTKINRDFIAVITDYIAPLGLAKTSTISGMASQFHHSQAIHDAFYSAETYRKDKDGNMVRGPLLMARQVWTALGEDMHGYTSTIRPLLRNVILTKSRYDAAAIRAYQDDMASVKALQYDAILHASSTEITQHAFVRMGCGTGKSAIYNLLLLCPYMYGCRLPRVLVVITIHYSLSTKRKHNNISVGATFESCLSSLLMSTTPFPTTSIYCSSPYMHFTN